MNLGDVAEKSVPKMMLVAAAAARRRDHDPHASFRTAAMPRSACSARSAWPPPACSAAAPPPALARSRAEKTLSIEHPTGAAEVFLDLAPDGTLRGAGTVRTARKLFRLASWPYCHYLAPIRGGGLATGPSRREAKDGEGKV